EHDLDSPSHTEAVHVRDRVVDLDVLVAWIEHRNDGRARLGQLARPDELRLHHGRDLGRVDLVLRARHLELRELGTRLLAPLAQHVRRPARDRDRALLGPGPAEELARAIEGARRLIATRAGVAEELRGARPALYELPLAVEAPPGHRGGGLGLAHLGLPRAH